MESLPLSEVQSRLPELIADLNAAGGPVAVTRDGVPVAVLMSLDELESLEETLDLLGDAAAMADIAESRAAAARGDVMDQAALEEWRDRLRLR